MNILIALIPAVAWGSIGLVSGKLGGNAYQQTLGMTIGALIFSLGAYLVYQPVLDVKVFVVGIASGLLWSVGQGQQFQSMQVMGVSRTVPMSTGMQLVGNTLAGALLFHEWQTTREVTLGSIALVILIIGATLTSRKDPSSTTNDTRDSEVGRGMRILLVSTIGYMGYTVIVDWGQVNAIAVILPQAIGMLLGACIMSYGKKALGKATAKNILTGLLWGAGNIFMFLSIPKVGLAVSYSLSQCGIIISTLGSIFLLGEKKTKKEMVYVTLGCLFVIAGGVLLGYMKA
ncbi:GRP family sugar transporter [Loigolactobacillus backii]|uniref:GRP family sugar transporter n=1 Tax=Loigolactobacillus backii TaxID=375175 RepID=UPI0007F0A854|nr:GRP family sugar transporter [Loigolactobacillus backii]ANK64832.1 glucose transporter GlcU [Loigolactobacillus backii]ANK66721.1 glucose transporter GlcU [Loigolactobacillus backii]MDA5388571.1 GRP family sugar transporter [Loigolactobacillus backii]MDA5391025.1 GRP family sugar transporter [Loigolactobacillus backii]OLF68487.1 glucose transporter GlcU [Loigolactobacillus backii]